MEGNGLFDLPLRNIPRRLALTVNRRSLVDDQFDEACALQDKMQIEHVANDGLDVYRDGLKLRAAINDGTKSDSAIPRMIAVELRFLSLNLISQLTLCSKSVLTSQNQLL